MRELCEIPDTSGEWLAALCTITTAPNWLKVGTAASISFPNLHRSALGAAERIELGLVPEISVLSPGRQPAMPGAKVAKFRAEPARADEVFHGGEVIVRHGIGRVLGFARSPY